MSEGFDPYKMTMDAIPQKIDISSPVFNTAGGGSKGGKASKSRLHDMTSEINRINEKLVDMKKNAEDLVNDFDDFNIRLKIDGLVGSEKVYAELEQEKDAWHSSVKDWQEKFVSAREEAEALALSAAKTGDAAVIASTNERVNACKTMEISAAAEADRQRRQIDANYDRDRKSVATQMTAYQADLEEAMNQGNVKSYKTAMDKIKETSADGRAVSFSEFEADLNAKQELMQQYHDWRMEAERSYQTLALEIGETMKNGLAASIADAVVYSKNLGEALRDVGKQILAMSIQFGVKKALAGVFANGFSGGNSDESFGYSGGSFFGFASGGVVTAPIFSLIGEGKDHEAVLPLNRRVLSHIADGIFDAGGGTFNAGQSSPVNNYFQVKDADSFKKSRSQISAEIYGAVQKGRR